MRVSLLPGCVRLQSGYPYMYHSVARGLVQPRRSVGRSAGRYFAPIHGIISRTAARVTTRPAGIYESEPSSTRSSLFFGWFWFLFFFLSFIFCAQHWPQPPPFLAWAGVGNGHGHGHHARTGRTIVSLGGRGCSRDEQPRYDRCLRKRRWIRAGFSETPSMRWGEMFVRRCARGSGAGLAADRSSLVLLLPSCTSGFGRRADPCQMPGPCASARQRGSERRRRGGDEALGGRVSTVSTACRQGLRAAVAGLAVRAASEKVQLQQQACRGRAIVAKLLANYC